MESPYLYGPYATPFMYFPEGKSHGTAAVEWTKQHIESFAKILTEEIGPYAAKHGVSVCDEPHL